MAKTFFIQVQTLVCWCTCLLLCRSHLDVVSTNIGNIEVAPWVSGFLPKVFLKSKNCDNIKYRSNGWFLSCTIPVKALFFLYFLCLKLFHNTSQGLFFTFFVSQAVLPHDLKPFLRLKGTKPKLVVNSQQCKQIRQTFKNTRQCTVL